MTVSVVKPTRTHIPINFLSVLGKAAIKKLAPIRTQPVKFDVPNAPRLRDDIFNKQPVGLFVVGHGISHITARICGRYGFTPLLF